jgi:DNA-binding beta-propeller fold protein YncE
LTTCQDAGGGSILDNIFSQSVILNSANTQAFINSQDFGNINIYQCAIDTNTGLFSSCTAVPITSPANYYSNYGFMALNPSNTLLYAIDGNNNRVLACPIVAGVLQGTCTDTGTTNIDDSAVGIALNQAGTTAYIGNYDGWVTTCSVSGAVFSNCTQHLGGGAVNFVRPSGVALNQAETLLYVTDYGPNLVYACTPSFSNCFVASSAIAVPYGIALNQTNTMAYVTNFTDTYSCPIQNDGTFGACVSHNGFNIPIGVALGY